MEKPFGGRRFATVPRPCVEMQIFTKSFAAGSIPDFFERGLCNIA